MPMASWRRQHQPVEVMDTTKSSLVTNSSTTSSKQIKQTMTITTSQTSTREHCSELSSSKIRNSVNTSSAESTTAASEHKDTTRVNNNVVESNLTTGSPTETSPTKKIKKKLSDASGKKKSKKSKKSEAEKENISVIKTKNSAAANENSIITNTITTIPASTATIATTSTTATTTPAAITNFTGTLKSNSLKKEYSFKPLKNSRVHEQRDSNCNVKVSLRHNVDITKSLESIRSKNEQNAIESKMMKTSTLANSKGTNQKFGKKEEKRYPLAVHGSDTSIATAFTSVATTTTPTTAISFFDTLKSNSLKKECLSKPLKTSRVHQQRGPNCNIKVSLHHSDITKSLENIRSKNVQNVIESKIMKTSELTNSKESGQQFNKKEEKSRSNISIATTTIATTSITTTTTPATITSFIDTLENNSLKMGCSSKPLKTSHVHEQQDPNCNVKVSLHHNGDMTKSLESIHCKNVQNVIASKIMKTSALTNSKGSDQKFNKKEEKVYPLIVSGSDTSIATTNIATTSTIATITTAAITSFIDTFENNSFKKECSSKPLKTSRVHEQQGPNCNVKVSLRHNGDMTKSLENIRSKNGQNVIESKIMKASALKNNKGPDQKVNKKDEKTYPLVVRGSDTCKENIGDWTSFIDVKKLKRLYQAIDENVKGTTHSLRGSKINLSHQPDEGLNSKRKMVENSIPVLAEANVTNMCRSYRDLTNVSKGIKFADDYNNLKRTKSVGDMLDKELNRIILTGVSVKVLRDSYCNLVTVEANKNWSKKSSFSKFDALQKKNLIHVRSNDAGKAQEKFNEAQLQEEKKCRVCGNIVYKMEEIKAERNTWHKNCFRCSECGKQLNVDTYQSHECILYCKPHFRSLFAPKAVEDNEPVKPRKPELIIRENQPAELPPDVVRASDKPDLGLEDLQQLNVKERFQVFEHYKDQATEERAAKNRDRSPTGVKRSTSILSKLAKFQAKGMDTGLDNESLSTIQYEDSSETEEEEEDDGLDDNEDAVLIRAKRAQRERPISFRNMNDIKSKFENGHMVSREERREERKQEIQNIRSRLFMGKQARIKEMYQQAVAESEQAITSTGKKPEIDIGDKARTLKEKFEKGEIFNENKSGSEEHKLDEEMEVFEQGISKNSRSIFKNLESSQQQQAPLPNQGPKTPDANVKKPQVSKLQEDKCKPFLGTGDVVKSTDKSEDIKIETSEVSSKFRFFEQYRPTEKERKPFRITPPREGVAKIDSNETEGQGDPNDLKLVDQPDDKSIAKERHTATKMLSIFRQMEETKNAQAEQENALKPLKRFTPPLDGNRRVFNNNDSEDDEDYEEGDSEEEEEEEEEGEEEESEEETPHRKYDDEFLRQAQSAARAKQLCAKFEKWEANEIQREMNNNSSVNLYEYAEDNDEGQVESAKSLRAKFEALRDSQTTPAPRPRVQVNRFV